MDRDGQGLFFDRAESFPKDRGYHSQAHSHIAGRRTNESLLDEKRLHRQGTGELDARKSNKKLRYTITLRHRQRISGDEEKGFEEKQRHDSGYFTPSGRERGSSRSSSALLPPELLEIVSTRWVPDDDGREIVTLTTKDGVAKANHSSIDCESRWMHIQSDRMTFRDFDRHVMGAPGLEDDDLALVGRLIRKVKKTSEKQFVHGRYLKPITLVYDGEDPDGGSKIPKTATFVSLPIFTTECPRKHTSTREDDLHPVRALLQSHYRLESTRKRDRAQVITKSALHEKQDHVVHVPQIWALIINKNTVITYAPLTTAVLRGESIKLMSYADAQLDEATWSVQFTDAEGNISYLPLRYVRSFFSLVKHIADDILHDEYNLVRDQLLKDGPLFKLFTKDDAPVTAETWPKMVEEKKTEVIQLKLIDNQMVSNRLLVTYCDSDGNELDYHSDSSSDTSSLFSKTGDESDTSEASAQSSISSKVVAPAVRKLRRLQDKFKEASKQGDTKKAENLRKIKIPIMEEEILELMAKSMEMQDAKQAHSHRKARVIIPDYEIQRPRSNRHPLHSPPLSPTSRSSSRSNSRSRPRFARRDHEYSRSSYDLSYGLEGKRIRYPSHDRAQSVSRLRRVRYDDFDPKGPQARSRPQSLALSRPIMSRAQSRASLSRSRWDDVRSRVLNGQALGHAGGIRPSERGEVSIYYKPSDKHLARSRWDFVRMQILTGAISAKSNDQAAEKPANNDVQRDAPSKITTAIQKLARGHDSPQELASPVDTLRSRPTNESAKKQDKKVTFGIKSNEVKPRLKRLINLAHKEVPALPKGETVGTAAEVSASPAAVQKTQDVPIFLWSTEHDLVEKGNLQEAPGRPGEMPRSVSHTASEEINRVVSTSKTEELILHTVVTEVHANLKRSRRVSPGYVTLYENTVAATFEQVQALAKDSTSGDTSLPTSADDDQPTEDPDNIMTTKQDILNFAMRILYAFVPESYEAAVVSKYLGALHKLLTGQDEEVLRYVGLRLAEMCALLRSIQLGVRTDDGSKQARYQIPRALPAAFQHIVISLVIIGSIENWSDYSWDEMRAAFDDCETLLIEGRKQLILMIHTDDYRESAGFQAVDSEALLSLILANLVDNLSTETDFHLTEIYSEYTTKIQSVVRDKASVEVYDDIKLLREELDVIKSTLKQQQNTLLDFRITMNLTYGVASISASVIDRTLESIEQRIDDFDELQKHAENARYLAAQSISLKAESNNKAIIVFTVVTIIFLPLSFVTSYLGMNTSDLREMKSGQTLFWAIGAPVAFVTFSVALMAAFYGTLTQRLTGKAWRGKEKAD